MNTITMNPTHTAHRLTVRREIAATADELFDAWLDPQSLGTWMRPCSEGSRDSDVRVDAREGGAFSITMHVGGDPRLHTGVYRRIDRPRRLVFTWVSDHTEQQHSLVTVDFNPKAPMNTEVVITHEMLPSALAVTQHTGGWTQILDNLLAARRPR